MKSNLFLSAMSMLEFEYLNNFNLWISALKSSKVIATIQSSWKTCLSFISSFAMTENYVIFMESPLLINCVKLAQLQIKHFALRDTFEWTPSEKVNPPQLFTYLWPFFYFLLLIKSSISQQYKQILYDKNLYFL